MTHESSAEARIASLERAYEMQKKAREEADRLLEEKSRELYHKNESLKAALDQVNQQQAQLVTQEKLASIGQLGASLAHELNNPNAFIQNNLMTMEEYIGQLSNGLESLLKLSENLTKQTPTADLIEQVRDQIRQIRQTSEVDFIREDLPSLMRETLNGTNRITSIANSLRYFANPDISTRKQLNINECIEQAQALVHSKGRLAEFTYELGQIPSMYGLPLLLSQAIANIIQNAVEAKSEKQSILLKSRQDGQFIYIDIQDHGVGIEADNISEVFKPFYSTKPSHNGLGLVIAQHIVQQHKGQITLESTVGEGTRVTISLPLTDA